ILLYTPKEKCFDKETLQVMGYNVQSSPTRLVMRSLQHGRKPLSKMYERFHVPAYMSAAACPINGASVVGQMIYWQVPLHITPLVSSEVEILEVHMGFDGRRLTPDEMESRNYAVTFKESHVVVEIPIGAADGYYKSLVLEDQYHISYTIEPMLELLWKEGQEKTSYKVLFHITTPLTPWPPQVTDYTQPEQMVFDVLLGYFLPDVELLNITFGSELLTFSEIIIQGINLQEHSFPNDTKYFALQVSFSEPYVQIKVCISLLSITYILDLVFGFVILPEHTAFSHSVVLEASLADIVAVRTASTFVIYGSSQIKIHLGHLELNNKILQQYEHHSNETHFEIIVPFLAPVVAFESVQLAGIMGIIDVEIYDSLNNWRFREFSLACPFFIILSECFSNGTITVVLPKLESAPHLLPGELSLRDPSCKRSYSQDYYAYFHFGVTTCGTTRKIQRCSHQIFTQLLCNKEYRLARLRFYTNLRQMPVSLSNAWYNLRFFFSFPLLDMVYRLFYYDGDYPVLKFLKQPLYFEVGMDHSKDSRVAVVLENCWATLSKDKESKPRWDLIVDGCANPKDPEQTIFHPVIADDRVDIPDHFKRFEVKTFAFNDSFTLGNHFNSVG
uniref:Zona pellucida protein AX 2 n=1 Tax=Sinocyclocheilus anshuiensis TaxID=1608454 RepID=A0A671QGJ0_9TELE